MFYGQDFDSQVLYLLWHFIIITLIQMILDFLPYIALSFFCFLLEDTINLCSEKLYKAKENLQQVVNLISALKYYPTHKDSILRKAKFQSGLYQKP